VANGLPCVDLHGLSVRLGLQVVQTVSAGALQTGGAVLITGRGNHTGGRSKLREAVLAHLDEHQIPFRPLGPGRVELILDAERVRAARPGMGLLFWLFVLLLLAGVVAAVLNRL
jgi:hypothetical protein